jgi:Ca-activated chloride channel family protein
MKRLRRTAIQAAILFSFAFVTVLPGTSLNFAQNKQETLAPTSSSSRATDSVMLTVTVTDRQRNYVKGLTRTNFIISDGKQEQQINAFSASDMPLSIGVLLDTSSSIEREKLKPIREALSRFFQLGDRTNEYFLVGINTQPKLLQDWTSDAESLLKQIDTARLDGATAIYDACYLAAEKVVRGRHQKHAIILVSDGLDTTSTHTYLELKRLLEESDIVLYAIGMGGRQLSRASTLDLERKSILEEFSSTTGGAVFFPDGPKQFNAVFDMIAIELRNQYLIRFTPTSLDGKRHSLKVQVDPPTGAPREMQSLVVRSRKSFYARASQR